MAAEAPITAKKGEYSGLSSEDILALFSGAATTTKGYDYVRLGEKNTVRSQAPTDKLYRDGT